MATSKIRIDKFLWCVRVYKTRALCKDACDRSKIFINNQKIKSSYKVKSGDIIKVKKKLISITFQVIDLIDRRIPAKSVLKYINDITPEDEKIKLEAARKIPVAHREKGSGRPTKKERRDIIKGLGNYSKS